MTDPTRLTAEHENWLRDQVTHLHAVHPTTGAIDWSVVAEAIAEIDALRAELAQAQQQLIAAVERRDYYLRELQAVGRLKVEAEAKLAQSEQYARDWRSQKFDADMKLDHAADDQAMLAKVKALVQDRHLVLDCSALELADHIAEALGLEGGLRS